MAYSSPFRKLRRPVEDLEDYLFCGPRFAISSLVGNNFVLFLKDSCTILLNTFKSLRRIPIVQEKKVHVLSYMISSLSNLQIYLYHYINDQFHHEDDDYIIYINNFLKPRIFQGFLFGTVSSTTGLIFGFFMRSKSSKIPLRVT